MAGFLDELEANTSLVYGLAILLFIAPFLYLFKPPSIPKNAPQQAEEQLPILGAWKFFTERGDWFVRQRDRSPTGNFSYCIGDKLVIGLSGIEGRRTFFDSKSMGFAEGYAALLAGAPPVKQGGRVVSGGSVQEQEGFSAYFSRRLIAMLKGNQLANGLPNLVADVRQRLDELASNSPTKTDPFDSIYRIVYQLTMRTVACNEIAADDELREETLRLFETVEGAASMWAIMFNWMPLISKARRTVAGAKLYMIFKRIIDARIEQGRREDDALQFMMDQKDDVTSIITFVLGALFAGQLNSGVNAAWILIYLATNPIIKDRVFAEVNAAANKYSSDQNLPLKDRLMSLPIEAWEHEFPLIDACLKDTIRLQLPGCACRKNISGSDIPLSSGEVIPKDAYVTYLVGDVHQDPAVYPDPLKWDPFRYIERAEDKKVHNGAIMWGVSRHPCLGMRFAKLENNLITAFFLAYFDDLQAHDSTGRLFEPPPPEMNLHAAHRPQVPTWLTYKVRS